MDQKRKSLRAGEEPAAEAKKIRVPRQNIAQARAGHKAASASMTGSAPLAS
jgi:hypothetical protein